MSTRKVIIDDRDSQVLYSPGWHVKGSENEYQRTTSYTDTQGASFTLTFVGTSVTVYGTLDAVAFPNTTYVLDGGDSFPFFGMPISRVQYQQEFYSSPVVPYGEHTLVGSCATKGAHVILDYLVVTMPLDLPTNATLPTATTTVIIMSNPKPIHPVATIVGSVLGAMLLMMTALNVLLWYRCFRSTSLKPEGEPDTRTRPFEIDIVSTSAPYHDVLVAAESHKPALPQLRSR